MLSLLDFLWTAGQGARAIFWNIKERGNSKSLCGRTCFHWMVVSWLEDTTRPLLSLKNVHFSSQAFITINNRGGSRFPHRRGRQLPRGGANLWFCQKFPKNCIKLRTFWTVGGLGAPTYDFAKFCEKLHENQKMLGRRGGGARRVRPP